MTNKCLMARMFNWLSFGIAFEAVKRNKGAAGIDRKSILETVQHWEQYGTQIEEKLIEGTYVPSPVLGVMIPKPNGGERLLGIPTVQDRVIQQAIQQELTTIFDSGFSDSSYGYRPFRSTHDAVKQAQAFVKQGKTWVIDIDISKFFDEVNHDILLHQMSQKVDEPEVLAIIRKYLKTGIMLNGNVERRSKGVPQGSPLSPLLANIYLDPLDKELETRGLSFCRYADDVSIYVGSERSAKRVLESLTQWIEKHLKLSVNQDKSGTGRPWNGQYLGFRINENAEIEISPKSIERYKGKVRQLWDAQQSRTSKQLVKQWRQYSIGWWNYFKLAENLWNIKRLQGWTRRHMRKCFWLRWHKKKGRLNALRRLGATPRVQKIAGSSRGAWRIAKSHALHRVLSNSTLRRYGLFAPSDLAVT
ncbi:MAG: group II intron reverse transcriptase/maturase [Methylococcales bacterium]|nr:group II intron reverse transcriptase/maturase [Methylococcales bacterium]MDQ7089434.1 group II intron reverse transcriptase/maturase [Methylococcales bacterium]